MCSRMKTSNLFWLPYHRFIVSKLEEKLDYIIQGHLLSGDAFQTPSQMRRFVVSFSRSNGAVSCL